MALARLGEAEHRPLDYLKEKFSQGRIVISLNPKRPSTRITGIGEGLATKVNANIGTSGVRTDLSQEVKKLQAACDAGADTIMDLSTGGNLTAIRRHLLAECPIPFGTVPIYQVLVETINGQGSIKHMDPERLFDVIEEQAADGVDFMTLHCGVTRQVLEHLQKHQRVMGIVSRGGTFLAEWMLHNKQENPLYEQFDRLLKIAGKHKIVISLGDGLRPGALIDAGDQAQVAELEVLGELTKRSWEADVQVIVEGPGHVPLHQIQSSVQQQKAICHNAPFYVLGPLVTDIAPGYDHITSAIGGAVAGAAGADFLCYVTPSEHLGLPGVDEVRQGVTASRIAAHAADIAKGVPGAMDRDVAMSRARRSLNWDKQLELAIEPQRARTLLEKTHSNIQTCSMCGEFCVLKQEHSLAVCANR
ncbi:MAG: phosphomethylpyrimidine synthase ThiC [Candidatus Schekmanbacteria bacterium]|nr:phosphomethylpyrimidine synthase ThiC [Candidatus Schekmanbacteria bacterium]